MIGSLSDRRKVDTLIAYSHITSLQMGAIGSMSPVQHEFAYCNAHSLRGLQALHRKPGMLYQVQMSRGSSVKHLVPIDNTKDSGRAEAQ